MKMISEFVDGDHIVGQYLVNNVAKGTSNNGMNYLSVDLRDCSGQISGKKWDSTSYDEELFVTGNVVYIEAECLKYKEALQLKITFAKPVNMEDVDVSITGNSTNPTRFQHPVAGTYKKECIEQGKKYFSVASGGGTGRTLHPDNMAAGPASYGMTDTMGRMHSDAQFAGSSSVPAHVEMMGFIGMGNNPMVGASVACAVAVYQALNK